METKKFKLFVNHREISVKGVEDAVLFLRRDLQLHFNNNKMYGESGSFTAHQEFFNHKNVNFLIEFENPNYISLENRLMQKQYNELIQILTRFAEKNDLDSENVFKSAKVLFCSR